MASNNKWPADMHPELRKLWATEPGSDAERRQIRKCYQLMNSEQQEVFRQWCRAQLEKQYKKDN